MSRFAANDAPGRRSHRSRVHHAVTSGRWLDALASPKRRRRFLDRLNHCRDLDERYASPLPSSTDVAALLRSLGAPTECHVLSDLADIDGMGLPLADAIDRVELGGFGSILSCVPGRLAYYLDESGTGRRLLLVRRQPPPPTGRKWTW